MNIKLYKKTATGALNIWIIYEDGTDLVIEWGQVGGAMQEQCEDVSEGKAGRSQREQMDSRINSRVKKQIDKGYVYSKKDAMENKSTNALGFFIPMKAKLLKDVKDISFTDAMWQYKYNGHRCMITCQNGVKLAYSKNGIIINTVPEVLDSVNVDEGMTIDGELYYHGISIQKHNSLIKRRQPLTEKLRFMCYDMVSDRPFNERIALARESIIGGKAEIVPTFNSVHSFEDAAIELNRAVSVGYEGLILRQDGYGYEDGKRSKALVKFKKFLDGEFLIKNIIESTDGWARLVCVTDDGIEFKASAPGSINEKFEIMRNKNRYIGKYVNITFAEWTDEKKPFHPAANFIRNESQE